MLYHVSTWKLLCNFEFEPGIGYTINKVSNIFGLDIVWRYYKMKKISAAEALELSIPERIQLVEEIWDTIAEGTESVELTEEEKKIIDARLEAYRENPDAGLSWEEVREKIVDRR
jgi:putative addiction module component (TIGR02574 family)